MSPADGAGFFEALGAVVIFLSWIVTNTISNRLASTRAAVDQATSGDDVRQRLATLRRGYREMKATLTRVDLMASELNPESIFSAIRGESSSQLRQSYGLVLAARESMFEHEDLQDAAFGLRSVAFADDLPTALKAEISTALQASDRIVEESMALIRTWEEARQQAELALRPGRTEDGMKMLQAATNTYIQAAAPLQQRSIAQRLQLLDLHGRALGFLVNRLNRLRAAHRISETLSWYLYASGTCLVLLGTWLRVSS